MALEAAYSFADVGSATVLDLSGNGRHITLTGTNGVQVAGGKQGGALGKNGATMPTLPSSVLAATETDDRTFMMDVMGTGRAVWWFRYNDDAIGSGIWGALALDGATLQSRARRQSDTAAAGALTFGTLLPADWRNICMTYVRATAVLTVYWQGNPIASGVPAGWSPGQQLMVGADRIDLAEWTDTGPAIDNVRVYSHALTPEEVLALAGTEVVAAAESAVFAGVGLMATLDADTTASADAVLAGAGPVATLDADATASSAAILAGTSPLATFALDADASAEGNLQSVLPMATMDLNASTTGTAILGATLPMAHAHFTISEDNMALAATSPVLCSTWATTEDLTAAQLERLQDLGADATAINQALLRASEILWAYSGRQWLGGGCEEDAVLRSFEPVAGTGTWPYSATWGHCGCWSYGLFIDGRWFPPAGGYQGAHMTAPSAVQLPRYAVTAVTSVTVGGEPFAAWILQSAGWLQRTDGQPWNVCGGDTEVTYQFGDPPPAGGRDSAIELAIEMLLDKFGSSECRLPPNTVSVTRQGITMELLSTDRPEFRTMLPLVDMWLEAVNPYRTPQSAQVWSPDVPRLARFGSTREV